MMLARAILPSTRLLSTTGPSLFSVVQSHITLQQRLDFLNKKEVMLNTKAAEVRRMELDFLSNPNKAPKHLQTHYIACQERLDRILKEQGDHKFDVVPAGVQTFEQFCKKVPGWDNPNTSFVFFRDHPSVKGKNVLAQRAQLSGLCYIHGPDMVQYYLVSMHQQKRCQMIDISKLIRDHFTADQLEQHIFDDKGGSSDVMLELILQPRSVVFASRFGLYETDLRRFGPALVSRFKVCTDFDELGKHSHRGSHSGKFRGLHAMALVGARKEGDRSLFLLQNWWREKQFIEVDDEYLKKCGGTVYFVETPQPDIPKEFPVDWARRFTENENMDKPESYPALEGPIKGWYGR